MKKRLLFGVLIGMLTACQHETDIQPDTSSLASEVVGIYRTNFYLDPSCTAIPSDQMPYIELKAESDSSVTVVYTKLYPTKDIQVIEHVLVGRQPEGVQLHITKSSIGTLQTDRVFTNNGMEKQGQLLKINMANESSLSFTGVKQ